MLCVAVYGGLSGRRFACLLLPHGRPQRPNITVGVCPFHALPKQDALARLAADAKAVNRPDIPKEVAKAIQRRRMLERKGLGECESEKSVAAFVCHTLQEESASCMALWVVGRELWRGAGMCDPTATACSMTNNCSSCMR